MMKEFAHDLIQYLPFIGMMVNKKTITPAITRLIEAGIIGAIVIYGTVKAISSDIEWIKTNLTQQNARIERLESLYIKPTKL